MRDDEENLANQDYIEEEYDNGFLRWMSAGVVLIAVTGFFALAWYAYHTGTQGGGGENIAFVEADKSPLKEAPADPGGLQFPHQDKTVYEAISNDAKAPKPTAERVLPAPEEPMKLEPGENAGGNDTGTWVNPGKARGNTASQALQVFEEEDLSGRTAASAPKIIRIDPHTGATSTTMLIPDEDMPAVQSEAGTKPAPPVETVEVKQVPVATQAKKAVPVKEAMTNKPGVSGAVRVQLGAFKSDEEAAGAWEKIRRNNASLVSGHSHNIMRVDLGAKGVFHRLQLSGFANIDQAKAFCTRLEKHQGCFPVKAN